MDWNDPWKKCATDSGIATLGCIPVLINLLVRSALMLAGLVALILIIYAGFRMTTSGGDPKSVEGAKKVLTFAIIGLLIVLFSFSILMFIGYVTGTQQCLMSWLSPQAFVLGC